ncbi:hypothetical protein Tco_0238632 [Tanacetum coccineum]
MSAVRRGKVLVAVERCKDNKASNVRRHDTSVECFVYYKTQGHVMTGFELHYHRGDQDVDAKGNDYDELDVWRIVEEGERLVVEGEVGVSVYSPLCSDFAYGNEVVCERWDVEDSLEYKALETSGNGCIMLRIQEMIMSLALSHRDLIAVRRFFKFTIDKL